MNTTTDTTILDIDALLDADMDNVETLPEYVTPSKGKYRLKVEKAEISQKDVKDKTTGATEKRTNLVATYAIQQTVESEDPPFPDGSLFTERWTASEDGLKFFKQRAMGILNIRSCEGAKLRELLDSLTGVEFDAVVTIRQSPGKDGKVYENIQIRALHAEPAA